MKKTITIIVLSIVCFSAFGQNNIYPDVIQNSKWELIDGPHGSTFGFIEFNGRIYAQPNFYSDDIGESWQPIPDFQDMISVVATDEVVFYINKEQQYCGTSSDSYVAQFYRSTDGGQTLDENIDLYQSSGRMGWSSFSTIVKNDHTFYYFYRFPLGGLGHFNYSNDAGETWQSTSHPLGSQNTSLNDTLVSYNQPPDERGVFFVFGNDDLSDPIIDSVYNLPDPVGSFLYVDGQYFVMSGGKLNVSKDRCQTWTEYTSPSTSSGLKYFEGSIYFSDSQSLYRFSIDSPSLIETIYTSSIARRPLVFGLFDGVFLLSDFDGIHRSLDNGVTWEQKTSSVSNLGRSLPYSSFNGTFQKINDRLWLGFNFDSHIYRSSVSGNEWEVLFDPIYDQSSLIGGKDDFVFLRKGGVLYRSSDFGETWQEVLTGLTLNDEWWVYDDKIYYGDLVSIDNGATWQPSTFVADMPEGTLVEKGDTLIKYWQNLKRTSIDKGVTWITDTLPVTLPHVFASGDTLVYFTGFFPTVNYSTDGGETWEVQTNWLFYLYTLNSSEPAKIFGFYDGIFLAHSIGRLMFSGNFDENWKTMQDIPFGTRIKHTGLIAPSPQIFVRGADQYLTKDGYLYAYSDGKGIWRIAISEIRDPTKISGKVFSDKNNNCQFDAGTDVLLSNIPVQVGSGLDITDENGEYKFYYRDGTYPVSVTKPIYHDETCPFPDSVTMVYSRGNTIQDFAFTPQPDKFDIKLSLSVSQPPRPGFPNIFRLTVKNIGSEPISTVPITFTFNPDHYLFIDAPGGNHQNGIVTFDTPIPLSACITFEIELEVLRTLPLGTEDVIIAEAPYAQDVDQSNNKVVLERTVRGAYDPNDKTAMPRDHIFPHTENEIEYLIRFQNTGTDTAFTVRVVDTIASQFNLLTLEMIDASHDYELTIEENQEVVWLFEDILLVDSFRNEPLSHGYIHFSIKTDSTVADMDTIKNEAAIYFDFNEPIITNETQNEVRKGLFEELNNYEICKGEMVNGQFYYESTFISDTIVGMFWDSIFNTEIVVHPVYSVWKDINLSPGDTFQNIVITSDTLIVEAYLTAFGCDSTVTTNIQILSSTKDIENQSLLLKAYPNPFTKDLTLEVTSESYGLANLEVLNKIGQIIFQKEVNLNVGKNKIPIEIKGSDFGLLTIKLSQRSNGLKAQMKVVRVHE